MHVRDRGEALRRRSNRRLWRQRQERRGLPRHDTLRVGADWRDGE